MSLGDLAMLLKISPHAVRTYLERGEGIARGNGYRLIEYFLLFYHRPPFICQKLRSDSFFSKEYSLKGFIRHQEENLAIRFLEWKYQKMNLIAPPVSELQRLASNIVDDGHRIARERGQNVISSIKELIADMKKDK